MLKTKYNNYELTTHSSNNSPNEPTSAAVDGQSNESHSCNVAKVTLILKFSMHYYPMHWL